MIGFRCTRCNAERDGRHLFIVPDLPVKPVPPSQVHVITVACCQCVVVIGESGMATVYHDDGESGEEHYPDTDGINREIARLTERK